MKKNAFFRAGLLLLSINIFFGEKLFSQNLLQNGGFECGGKGTGFNVNSSFYTDVTSSLPKASSNVGNYAVTNDPYNLNSSIFLHGTDHSGSGKMLVVDGVTTVQQILWQAGSSGGGICGLTVGATYYFSYWVKSVSSTCTDPSTCANLAVKFINNSGGQWPAPTTGSQMVGLPAAGWQQVIYTFVPTNACVNIEIINNNTNIVGNDFALDDMSVVAAVQPPLSLTQTHTSPTCYIKGSDATDGTDGTIFGYASGGSSPYTFNLTSTNLTPTVSLSNGSGAFTGLLSGTYNLSVTDSKSTTVSLTGIVLGHLEDTLKTGIDTSICLGGSANLSVTGGYNIPYVWSPSGSLTGSNSNPVATPGSTTTYLIHSDTTITITSSQNLITNGDFESGNSGFYSDYIFNNNNTTLAQKVYGIVTNPQTFESGFTACATHGGTKQLVADGSTFLCGSSASDKIWAQTVNVVPGTTYTLTYYAQTVSAAGNPAQLSVKINGTTVGATASPTSAACNWLKVTNTWTPPVGVTAAEIALYDLNSVAAGNDFAIDDISFIGTSTVTKNCKLTDSIKVTVLTPQAPVINCGTLTTSSVQFNWNTIAGATSYDYSYQINSGTPSAVQNTTSTTVTISSGVVVGDNVTITITPKGTGCFTSNTQTCTAQNCPVNTVTPASAAPTLCINTPLTSITHTTTGATGIGTATGLPTGVTAAWNANTITISGTPTAAGTFNYTIPLTGGCGAVSATGTITVITVNTASIASTTPNLCINTVLTNITHTTTGATGIGAATGLPTGVTAAWNANTITISGTPTAAGTFNYTIPLTGGCGAVNATGTITVTNVNTVSVASSAPTLCINTPLTSITHTTTGATGIGTATGLPTGVTAAWNANTITISGIPTAAGTFNYTIPLTGGCGAVSATGTITVTNVNTVTTASSAPTLCINTPLTSITHTTTGATGIGAATGLPTGVTAAWNANTITISGTPTAAGTFNYSIPLLGGCGAVNAIGTITVTNVNTASVASSAPTLCINTPLTSITHTTTGATGIGAATGLPTGVTAAWNANTITISGTPTAAGTFNYTIPLTGGCGAVNATGTITVTNVNTVTTASSAPTLCINTTLTNITHTTTGATGIGTATGLPTGVTAAWNANTITISGTPTAAGTFNYSIPLTGGCGNIAASGSIIVRALPNATITGTTTVCQNATTPNITFTGSGGTSPYTFTYNINGGSSQTVSTTGANSSVTVPVSTSASGPNTYNILSVADGAATSCSAGISGQSATVTVIGTPATPTASVTVQPTCTTNGTIVITSPTGAGLEYSIDGSNYQSSTTFSGLTPAIYNVTVRTTTGQCVSAPLPLTVNAPPGAPAAPTASVTTQPTCIITTGTITITAPTGATLQYTKDGTNYQTGTTFTGLTPGLTYNINVKDFSSGCVSAATTLTINNIPANPATPTAGVTVQPDCANPNGTIVVTAPTGASIQYSIDGSNYQSSGTFPGLNPGNTYNITAKNTSTGCVSSAATLTINSIPGAPAAPTASITQQPNCNTPTGTIIITAPIGANFQYSNGGAYQSGTSFTGLTPGNTYNITVKNTTTGCVSNSTILTINALPANPAAPTANVTQQPNCITPTGIITITAPIGANYEYSKGGAYQTGTTFTNLTPNTTYNITARDISTGCISSATIVTINALPANPATPTASVTDAPSCITPTGTIAVSNPTGNTIRYSIDGTSYQSSNIFSGLTPNQTYNITAKDVSTGCISSAKSITIPAIPANPATPTASVTQQPNCIAPTGTIAITAPTGSNIEYSIDGNAYQISNIFSGLTPGNSYSITAKNTLTGCISSPKNLNINSIPNGPAAPTVSVTAQPTCIIQTGTITITAPTGGSILYTIDGNSYSSTKVYSGLLPGSSYTVIAKDNTTGCTSGPSVVNINEIPANPVVNAGPDKEIMQGQNATLNGQATGNGLTYVWTPNISISNAGVLTPTVNPTNDQVYTLTATSKDGCVASDNVKITVVKEIVVPNAFSPNEDNINDTWIIENINYYPNADIKIFNRYGQFVFESRGYQIPWDGTYKGQKVPVGTYFWIIKLKPDSKPRSGSISVIR